MITAQDAANADRIDWRLQVCMAQVGIRFASDLHRRLVAVLGEDRAPWSRRYPGWCATDPNG